MDLISALKIQIIAVIVTTHIMMMGEKRANPDRLDYVCVLGLRKDDSSEFVAYTYPSSSPTCAYVNAVSPRRLLTKESK